MTIELLLLLLASGLMLGAVLARRATSPRARASRIATLVLGALCAVAALILMGSESSTAPPGPIDAVITNELGSNQLSERITVMLDGRDVGVLAVDGNSRTARLAVTLSKAGRYGYKLEAQRVVRGRAPSAVSSEGDVVIDGTSDLAVFSNEEGETFLLAKP